MINVVKLNASACAWAMPISEVLESFIRYNKITREQIISVSFPDIRTCILVFEKVKHKPEDCRYYTSNAYLTCGGCLGTKEVDPCKGEGCENWKPKEEEK